VFVSSEFDAKFDGSDGRLETHHPVKSWLKEDAPVSIFTILVAFEVFTLKY